MLETDPAIYSNYRASLGPYIGVTRAAIKKTYHNAHEQEVTIAVAFPIKNVNNARDLVSFVVTREPPYGQARCVAEYPPQGDFLRASKFIASSGDDPKRRVNSLVIVRSVEWRIGRVYIRFLTVVYPSSAIENKARHKNEHKQQVNYRHKRIAGIPEKCQRQYDCQGDILYAYFYGKTSCLRKA
jgi:hypothetical protein